MGVGRIIEAFDDPLIGWLSDRTRSRWGRRAPFIFLATPVVALFFFLLWLPPLNQGNLFYALYFFIVLQLFFLAYTLSEAPLAALLPEIVKTSQERVEVSAWKVFFGVMGAALGLIGTGLVISRFGFPAMGLAVGLMAALSFYLALLGILKHQNLKAQPSQLNLWLSLVYVLKNRAFLAFSLGMILFGLGVNLLTQLLPFFVKVVLHQGAETVSLLMAGLMIVIVLSLPLMAKLAKKFSKRLIYGFSMVAVACLFPLLYFVGFLPGLSPLFQAFFFVALLGLPFSSQFLFPNALMADVVDNDFSQTGQRREALFYSLQDTLQKFSLAASAIIFGVVMSFFGYSPDNPLGIRLMGLTAGIFVFLGAVIFLRYYQLRDEVKK